MAVILAPSGFDMQRFKDYPARVNVTRLPHHALPASNGFLPDHGGNGPFATPCMCQIKSRKPGSSDPQFACARVPSDHNQHAAIRVTDQDYLIAAGEYREGTRSAIQSWGEPAQQELWNLVQERGITHLLYTGFATNMCIINREFAMIQVKRLGLRPILVRDATLSITYDGYNPMTRSLDTLFRPQTGTRFGIEYIEERIGPSIDSAQIVDAAAGVP